MKGYSESCQGLQDDKQKHACLSRGNSLKKTIKRVAKHGAEATVVIVGKDQKGCTRSWLPFPTCCTKQLPATTAVLIVRKGKVVSERSSIYQLKDKEELGMEYAGHNASLVSKKDVSEDGKEGLKNPKEIPLSPISHLLREIPDSTIGWPLTRRAAHKSRGRTFERDGDIFILKEEESEIASSQATQTSEDDSASSHFSSKFDKSSSSSSFPLVELPSALQIAPSTTFEAQTDTEARKTSVLHWLRSLPSRSASKTAQTQITLVSNNIEDQSPMPIKWFSYEELRSATSEFSSDNLIGEGGCSSVYKGTLPSGKLVAVKVLKSFNEGQSDMSLEMDIISSLRHKHITSLIGICFEKNCLISVYNFMHKGTLEEHLHGNRKKSALPWDVRFKAAVAVAEALNYLHNERSRPVIHRDVKSSNILLSDEFHPQLSDFGLAIWGPTDSTYMVQSDVVGTFGYMAPEYFTHGRVSDKTDVYSFGVVLLELLSGRRPIGPTSKCCKRQESLVKLAQTLIDCGKFKALVDPKLGGKFNIIQMHRMVLAASLCISPSARLRPKVSQILQLLKGEKDAQECVESHINDLRVSGNQEDDETHPGFGSSRSLDFPLLELDDDDDIVASLSSSEPKKGFTLKDYFNDPL